MEGIIISVNLCGKKGGKKKPQDHGFLVKNKGVKNDAHFSSKRQVSFLDWGAARKLMKKSDITVSPGDFAENITTEGIDWKKSATGDIIRIIASSKPRHLKHPTLKITQIGKECHSGCIIYKTAGECVMPEEGVFAQVLVGGNIKNGDRVIVESPQKINIGILTCSDKASKKERADTSGPAIESEMRKLSCGKISVDVKKYAILPDEKDAISKTLKDWCDKSDIDIIFTTGGTGFGPRDWTPEATREAMERLCPGIPEFIRWESFKKTKFAAISRATAGIRKNTLLINLPGSEKAAREIIKILFPIIPHSIDILRGKTEHK